jgi:hypothetical protein
MIRDEDITQALVETVARHVGEPLVPLEHQVADEDRSRPRWCRRCARWPSAARKDAAGASWGGRGLDHTVNRPTASTSLSAC